MERVGPYEIPDPNQGRLGEGGMGVVYRAFDPRLRREVALKLVRAAREGDEASARLLREARSAAAIAHPNVATIYEVGEHAGEPYIAMELVEGESLRARLRGGPLAIEELIRLARGIARGLSAAHKVGVIHRDLKPSNVMITGDGRVVLLDFGLAQATPQAQLGPTQSVTLTEAGLTHGTPGYMPPEQSMGYVVDERSDLFALGVTLYECATGRRPFEGTTPTAIALATLTGAPPPVRKLRPDAPVALADLIHALLEKKPEKRPQSAAAVAAELESMLTETQTTKILAGAAEARRPSLWVVAGLVALVVTVASVGVYLGRTTGSAPPPRVVVADLALSDERAPGVTRMLEIELAQFRGFELVEPARPYTAAQARAALSRGDVDRVVVGGARMFERRVELRLTVERRDGGSVSVRARKPGVLAAVSAAADKISQQLDGARRKAGSLLTQNIDAYRAYERGERAWYTGDTTSALNLFREAVELDRAFILGHYRLALCLKWLGDPEARPAARRALELLGDAPELAQRKEVAMLEGLVAELAGDHDKARMRYDELLAAHPYDRDVLFARGDLAFHAGRHSEALGYFRRVVNYDSSFLSAYQHYIWALLRSDRAGEAQAALEDFLARHRKPIAFIVAGRGWMRLGELKKAVEVFEGCARLHGQHSGCATHHAGALAFLGQHDAAARILEEQMGLMDVRQANDAVLAAQGRLFTFLGRRADAERALRTRARSVDTPVARAHFGRWLLENGRVDDAAAWLRETDLDRYEGHVFQAHLTYALTRGDLEGARAIARRAPEPDDLLALIDTWGGCASSTAGIPALKAAMERQEIFRERYELVYARCLVRAGREVEAIAVLDAHRAAYAFGDEASFARPAALALLTELRAKRGDAAAARAVGEELLALRASGDPALPDVARVKAALAR